MSIEIGEGRRGQAADRLRPRARAVDHGALVAAVGYVRVLLIALWLGAAVFFSAAVAPSAFAVLRSFHLEHANEIAGSIVTRTLSIINVGGFLVGLLLLASAFLFRRTAERRLWRAEVISLLVIVAATGVGQWVIAARMLGLRAAMGRPVDEVAQSDPLRVAFNSLHGYSVGALSIGILAGALALFLIARRARPNTV